MRVQVLCFVFVSFCLGVVSSIAGAQTGRIEGRVVHSDGWGVAGVQVEVEGLAVKGESDSQGQYVVSGVPRGTYRVSFALGEVFSTRAEVKVEDGEVTEHVETVNWEVSYAASITVQGASRRAERIVDAPAAITALSAQEVARQSSHGELPRLLGFGAGVELTQSGLYDYSLNSRGFNLGGAMNNRIVTLIDGRDPSLPAVGSQEWSAVAFPLDELDSVEFIRGPGAALYGAGAYNGVLNLVTKPPRDSQGGLVRLGGGELDTRRFEGRHAGALGDGWYYRIGGGFLESQRFSRSRVVETEYAPGRLPLEAGELPSDNVEIAFGSLRFDKDLGSLSLSLETGTADVNNTIVATPAGRNLIETARRPWARFNLNGPRFNVLGFITTRKSDELLLGPAAPTAFDSYNLSLEWQGNVEFDQAKGRLVGGVSVGQRRADSADDLGRQTLLRSLQRSDRYSTFGQVDYRFTGNLRGVVSARFDNSDLYPGRVSPRGALVFAPSPSHTLRLSYGNAFKTPTFSEYFFELPMARPVDLSGIEAGLKPLLGPVSLGFDNVPILLLGNEDLGIEKIRTLELGYNGILGRKTLLTVTYYRNELMDFTTGSLPQVGTSLGRLNPTFGAYEPPPELPDAVSSVILDVLRSALPPDLFASLSNNLDGTPIFAALSFATFGRVETEGVELDLTHAISPRWQFNANYNFFDFEVKEELRENPLVPNAPGHRVAATLSYLGDRFDALVKSRWVESHRWRSGLFDGTVPHYNVVEATLRYALDERITLGVDVANVLDEGHYEVFGGDVLERRAQVYVSYSW